MDGLDLNKPRFKSLFFFISLTLLFTFYISLNMSIDSLQRFIIDYGEDITIHPKGEWINGYTQASPFNESDLENLLNFEGIEGISPRLIGEVIVEGITKESEKRGPLEKWLPTYYHTVIGIEPSQDWAMALLTFKKGGFQERENCCIVSTRWSRAYNLSLGDFVNITHLIHHDTYAEEEPKLGGYLLGIVGIYEFNYKHPWELLGAANPILDTNSIIVHAETAQEIFSVEGFYQFAVKVNSKGLWSYNYKEAILAKAKELERNFDIWFNIRIYSYYPLLSFLLSIRLYFSSLTLLLLISVLLKRRWPTNFLLSIFSAGLGFPIGAGISPLVSRFLLIRPVPLVIDVTSLAISITAGFSIIGLATCYVWRRGKDKG